MTMLKKYKLMIISFAILILFAPVIYAQSPDIASDIRRLLDNVQTTRDYGIAQSALSKESPRYSVTSKGFLNHLGAPPSHYFPVATVVAGMPEVTALNFLNENATLFGIVSKSVNLKVLKSRGKDHHNYVRYEQSYGGIPVFGAQIIVQLNELDGVEYVTSDIALDVDAFDKGIISVIPSIIADEAIVMVRDYYLKNNPDATLTITPPQLRIYDPSIIGNSGSLRLVWDMKVYSDGSTQVHDQILLDAHTGEVALKYPLNIPALRRDIFDSNNTSSDPGARVRSDVQNPPGPGPTGIGDADNAYDFTRDAYDFYWNKHGRDGIEGLGWDISSTVRFCSTNTDICSQCPCRNAFWNGLRLYFGGAMVADDVLGHEYTHGVTQFESFLIYLNQSGAINESFSDIWGEFIDLTNGAGTDTPEVKWLIGEDIGTIRSMKNPPSFSDPDRMGSPLFYTGPNDNGGVHTNSGVGNKLTYLLTDGDTFNGQTVTGLGIDAVADLFYEVNANLLTSGANYSDLYHSLVQAAINLGWTNGARNNLYKASLAAEIADSRDIYVDNLFNGCLVPNGEMACFMFFGGPFKKVIDGVNPANPGDRLFIKAGTYNEQLTIDKVMELNAWGGVVTIGQ